MSNHVHTVNVRNATGRYKSSREAEKVSVVGAIDFVTTRMQCSHDQCVLGLSDAHDMLQHTLDVVQH